MVTVLMGDRLTDMGHTLMHLSYENDIDKLRDGTRGKLFEQIKSETFVKEINGALFIDTDPVNLVVSLFRMGQDITKINDLAFLKRTRADSTFYDDLHERLFRVIPSEKIKKDYFYAGIENPEDYTIDYRIEGKEEPIFLLGIPNKDKARLTTITLERLLRARISFDSLLVFSDQKSMPRADLARLSNAGGEMIASLDAESDFQRKILKKVQAN